MPAGIVRMQDHLVNRLGESNHRMALFVGCVGQTGEGVLRFMLSVRRVCPLLLLANDCHIAAALPDVFIDPASATARALSVSNPFGAQEITHRITAIQVLTAALGALVRVVIGGWHSVIVYSG
jgi:hypothetical protein